MRVEVKTRLGHDGEKGKCLDYLPVFTEEGTKKYLMPTTRMLVNREAASEVNCSLHYPIIFQDKLGNLITANPEVELVNM